MAEDLHIVMHVPKTGGQTLRDHLQTKLAFHTEFIHLGPKGDSRAKQLGLAPWAERTPQERAKARVILGHDASVFTKDLVPGERAVKYCGMLRDPASRMVSHYNFNVEFKWVRAGKDAPDWTWWSRGQKRNFMCSWIKENFLREPVEGVTEAALYEDITRLLSSFWLLGVSERHQAFADALCADIGIATTNGARVNAAGDRYPQRAVMTPEIAEAVYRDHPVDKAVYDWVLARLDQNADAA
jgi:hypothetical protein